MLFDCNVNMYNSGRTSKVNWKCGETEYQITDVNQKGCLYIFDIQSRLACKN